MKRSRAGYYRRLTVFTHCNRRCSGTVAVKQQGRTHQQDTKNGRSCCIGIKAVAATDGHHGRKFGFSSRIELLLDTVPQAGGRRRRVGMKTLGNGCRVLVERLFHPIPKPRRGRRLVSLQSFLPVFFHTHGACFCLISKWVRTSSCKIALARDSCDLLVPSEIPSNSPICLCV